MQGKTVNGYTLQRQLGVGGMAEVWLAENSIGKKAAVKLLLPRFCADEAVVARFENEARVMVQLDHPNIRQVYDYCNLDGRPCIVMEYLEGDDLKALMKKGFRFTDAEICKWWNQIADALNYTHAQGIVHRDIKPSNIFLDKKGNIKLLDFGIAKIKESISLTMTGAMMGTLMYMSPEQVEDSKHIGPQSDIYSLAVTFVHLLTGKAPYDITNSSDYAIRKSIVEIPLDLAALPASWRLSLEPYLSKDPQERPVLKPFAAPAPKHDDEATAIGSNAVPLEDDEATFIGDAVKQPPMPKPVPAPKPTKKKAKTIGLVIAGVVVAALLALLLWPSGGVKEDYIDLGLPSGTLWKNINENNEADKEYDFFTYDEAMERFGKSLPSKEQWEELKDKCQWTWTGDGYEVTGPNGNSITLPGAGIRECDGSVHGVGPSGVYWSSTSNGSEGACFLLFFSDGVGMPDGLRCGGNSVRLVQY